jgi:hypothetical protein
VGSVFRRWFWSYVNGTYGRPKAPRGLDYAADISEYLEDTEPPNLESSNYHSGLHQRFGRWIFRELTGRVGHITGSLHPFEKPKKLLIATILLGRDPLKIFDTDELLGACHRDPTETHDV